MEYMEYTRTHVRMQLVRALAYRAGGRAFIMFCWLVDLNTCMLNLLSGLSFHLCDK